MIPLQGIIDLFIGS